MLDATIQSLSSTSAASLGPIGAFWWAAGGSLALEIISLFNEIKAQKTTGLPGYYKSWIFWVVRIAVTAIAGGLAVAEEASSKLLAVNIGASAPAILQLLASRPTRASDTETPGPARIAGTKSMEADSSGG